LQGRRTPNFSPDGDLAVLILKKMQNP